MSDKNDSLSCRNAWKTSKKMNKKQFYCEFSLVFEIFCVILHVSKSIKMAETKDINRIKVMLVEKKRSNKWLAEQLGKDPATVSKWCTNTSQPTIETLLKIAEVLEVNYTELVRAESVITPKD